MSADVLFQPRLMRIAQPASAAGTPIASRTGDRCTFPDEQAAIIEFDEPYGKVTHATFLLSDFMEAEEESLH